MADKEDPRKESLGELSRRQNVRIEEALFLLALYEDKTQGFQQMRPLLVKLWGEQRNFNLFENAGLLKWLIDYYEEEIMAYQEGLVGTEKTYERDYLWNYVSEIPNRKVFDFWRQYLEKNDMMEIPEFFGASCFFHTRLGKCLWGYSHTDPKEGRLCVTRK